MPQLPPIGSPMPDEGLPPIGSPMPDDLAPPPSAEQLVKTGGTRLWRAATDPIIGPLSPLDILGMGSAGTLAVGGAAKLFGGLRRAKPLLTPTAVAPPAAAAPRIPARPPRRLVHFPEEFAALDRNRAARLAIAKPEAVVKGTEYAAFGKKGAPLTPLSRLSPTSTPTPPTIPPGTQGLGGPPATAPPQPPTGDRLFNLLQTLRAESALSGLSVPKNILTGVGAAPQLAVEMKSLKPITETLRPRAMAKSFGQGFKTPIDIGAAGGQRLKGPFSRTISGVDKMFMDALARAGVPQARSDQVLLREPLSEYMAPAAEEFLKSKVGKTLALFQRTPVNQFFGGGREMMQAVQPGTPAAQRVLTLGALGTGAAAGAVDDNPARQALTLPLLFALAGRRGLATGLGAAVGIGASGQGKSRSARALAGQAPFAEYGLSPLHWAGPPAFVAAKRRVKEALRGRTLSK